MKFAPGLWHLPNLAQSWEQMYLSESAPWTTARWSARQAGWPPRPSCPIPARYDRPGEQPAENALQVRRNYPGCRWDAPPAALPRSVQVVDALVMSEQRSLLPNPTCRYLGREERGDQPCHLELVEGLPARRRPTEPCSREVAPA